MEEEHRDETLKRWKNVRDLITKFDDGGPGKGISEDFTPRKWPWPVKATDMVIKKLGLRNIPSPVDENTIFMEEATTVLLSSRYEETFYLMASGEAIPRFQRAGPRRMIYHEPKTTKIAILTAGGLCPGLNDVIRSVVVTAKTKYGVPSVLGIRHGYNGLRQNSKSWPPIELELEDVHSIHMSGGSILGMSRGPIEAVEAVDSLVKLGVNILYCLGGDGTQKAAHAIHLEVEKRELGISVIGIPKTIDNDVNFVEKTFGFDTAVEQAATVLQNVSNEAEALDGGVGLVRLMGRDSGFIAADATLAAGTVDFCLIPELPIQLDAFLDCLQAKLTGPSNQRHAVIAVAEGAGQAAMDSFYQEMGIDAKEKSKDASGNVIHRDIGPFLKDRIKEHAKKNGYDADIKYIDPSYIIRSCKACPSDSIYCTMLGQNAVHAGMAGKTDMLVGTWHGRFTHVPLPIVVMARKKIDLRGQVWSAVIQATEVRSLLKGAVCGSPPQTPEEMRLRSATSFMRLIEDKTK